VLQRLPFVRKQSGPLLTEQRLLTGTAPEFVCTVGGQARTFALDTGTSMTTLAHGFADELGVAGRTSAGRALDGLGRDLPVEVGVLDDFAVGDVVLGAIPVLVIDDVAMQLRDFGGGPDRVPRGMLGLDLLGSFRLTLDPERTRLVLELPRGLDEDQSVQCLRVEGRCLVPVTVDGVRLWFVLDTGASHSSLTTAGITALPNGAQRAAPTFRPVRTVGGATVAVRAVADLELRVSEVMFQGVTLPVVLRGTSGVFPVHGVLGMDLLGRCVVTFDRGRLRLRGQQG
jgi:predicted aspartyl protease